MNASTTRRLFVGHITRSSQRCLALAFPFRVRPLSTTLLTSRSSQNTVLIHVSSCHNTLHSSSRIVPTVAATAKRTMSSSSTQDAPSSSLNDGSNNHKDNNNKTTSLTTYTSLESFLTMRLSL